MIRSLYILFLVLIFFKKEIVLKKKLLNFKFPLKPTSAMGPTSLVSLKSTKITKKIEISEVYDL
jgi:hypothetical protein